MALLLHTFSLTSWEQKHTKKLCNFICHVIPCFGSNLQFPIFLLCSCCNSQHTPLKLPGIFVRNVLPDTPAALCGRIRVGDQIVAVNGKSIIGSDYDRYGMADSDNSQTSFSIPLLSSPSIIFFFSVLIFFHLLFIVINRMQCYVPVT